MPLIYSSCKNKCLRNNYVSRLLRKPTLWTLLKGSIQISLSMLRRLTWTDNVRLLKIFCFRNHYSLPPSPWDGMCRHGLACVDCVCWSGLIHYAEAIMLVFSRNSSYMHTLLVVIIKYLSLTSSKHPEDWATLFLGEVWIDTGARLLITFRFAVLSIRTRTSPQLVHHHQDNHKYNDANRLHDRSHTKYLTVLECYFLFKPFIRFRDLAMATSVCI